MRHLNLLKILGLTPILFILPVVAPAAELDSPGSIIVSVIDEAGNPVPGATVTLTLPDSDGKINYDIDKVITKKDGVTDDDLKVMEKKAADGDVEFEGKSVLRSAAEGNEYLAAAGAAGLVDAGGKFIFKAGEVNALTVKLEYAFRVTATDSKGALLPGFSVSVAGGGAVKDGAAGDADGAENGVILMKQVRDAAGEAGPVAMVVSYRGIEKKVLHSISSNKLRPLAVIFEDPADATEK